MSLAIWKSQNYGENFSNPVNVIDVNPTVKLVVAIELPISSKASHTAFEVIHQFVGRNIQYCLENSSDSVNNVWYKAKHILKVKEIEYLIVDLNYWNHLTNKSLRTQYNNNF